jgi:hypothetical protein
MWLNGRQWPRHRPTPAVSPSCGHWIPDASPRAAPVEVSRLRRPQRRRTADWCDNAETVVAGPTQPVAVLAGAGGQPAGELHPRPRPFRDAERGGRDWGTVGPLAARDEQPVRGQREQLLPRRRQRERDVPGQQQQRDRRGVPVRPLRPLAGADGPLRQRQRDALFQQAVGGPQRLKHRRAVLLRLPVL